MVDTKVDKLRAMKKKPTGRMSGSLSGTLCDAIIQFQESLVTAWQAYRKDVSGNQRLMLIDTFCLGLVVLGVIQFSFIVVRRDTFPFNAFLSGFIACVGQFVLLVSLRLQIGEEFKGISKPRAFGEFTFASLVLHFICLHFIN
ncbi:HFL317Wp [Eremothecium sinecaudum]|uniref:Dolichyl-diphosphooligosaccharide--protein glycosyltransferase subunit OST2 n=1 Tax=Eremothecium sinecaudum TaxID=45286 RepID=A0A0X8HU51_9SACH|nr:HFL317Wp [Eremothecium sinecaudum]AMD21539.1 HFL317Wp [Eremothecium sinecaudum]